MSHVRELPASFDNFFEQYVKDRPAKLVVGPPDVSIPAELFEILAARKLEQCRRKRKNQAKTRKEYYLPSITGIDSDNDSDLFAFVYGMVIVLSWVLLTGFAVAAVKNWSRIDTSRGLNVSTTAEYLFDGCEMCTTTNNTESCTDFFAGYKNKYEEATGVWHYSVFAALLYAALPLTTCCLWEKYYDAENKQAILTKLVEKSRQSFYLNDARQNDPKFATVKVDEKASNTALAAVADELPVETPCTMGEPKPPQTDAVNNSSDANQKQHIQTFTQLLNPTLKFAHLGWFHISFWFWFGFFIYVCVTTIKPTLISHPPLNLTKSNFLETCGVCEAANKTWILQAATMANGWTRNFEEILTNTDTPVGDVVPQQPKKCVDFIMVHHDRYREKKQNWNIAQVLLTMYPGILIMMASLAVFIWLLSEHKKSSVRQ